MFQILTMTEARLATLTPRAEKHGDDDVPAVSLGIEIEAPNTLLDTIDPAIRQALYKPVDDQEQLPGVEPATPVLRCNAFESVKLTAKHEGWTLSVDDGIDDTKPLTFGGCKVDKFVVDAKQGGSIVLRFRIGTSDLDAERSGMLGMHVGQPIWLTLKAPEKQPDAIDASSSAKDLPPTAEDLFAAGQEGPGEGDTDDEGGIDAARGSNVVTLSPDGAWPFPKDAASDAPPQSVTVETSRPGTRTARGRDKTKQALAAREGAES